MEKLIKSSLILIIVLVFSLMLSCISIYADDEIIEYGTFGGVPWELNNRGELYIGEENQNYDLVFQAREPYNDVSIFPWNKYSDKIILLKVLGTVRAHGNISYLFGNLYKCETMDLKRLDISDVTSLQSLFDCCFKLQTLDISTFNTSNVTNMTCMFSACQSIKTLDLSHFDTRNIKGINAIGMFSYCQSLETVNITGFDLSKCTAFNDMFNGCECLQTVDLSVFHTDEPITADQMFKDCRSLVSLDLSPLNMQTNPGTYRMLQGLDSLKELIIGNDTHLSEECVFSKYCKWKKDGQNLILSTSELLEAAPGKYIAGHLLQFDNNGHGNTLEAQFVEEGDYTIKPLDPYEEGFKFMGWFLTKSGKDQFQFGDEITDDVVLYAKWIVPCGTHSWDDGTPSPDATCEKDGLMIYNCSVCGDIKTEIIPASHKWNEEYTIDKEATCTEEGSKSIHCSVCDVIQEGSEVVIPKLTVKATSLSKPTAIKKGFTVKWKKGSNITGYEVQYALNSKFTKSKKTVTITKASTVSKKITKLKSKKKYYVRIRTYKTFSGKKYYSTWSKSQSVKTK